MKARALVAVAALACAAACAPGASDLAKWEASDERGPERLAEVVASPKRATDLRRDAGLALLRLERRGRRVGLDLLLKALTDLPATDRDAVVAALAPALARLVSAERPAGAADPTLAAKDLVYALLSRQLADAPTRGALRAALLEWARRDTLARIADPMQRYGPMHTFRLLGPESLTHTPALLAEPGADPRTLAALVAEVGDEPSKARAVEALAKRDASLRGEAWAEKARAEVDAANRAARVSPTAEQRALQLEAHRASERDRGLQALRALGTPDAVAELVARAADATDRAKSRADALRALGPHAKALAPHVAAIAAIAGDRAHGDDDVREQASALLVKADAPTPVLLGLFGGKTPLARFHAARHLLSRQPELPLADFMARLPVDDKTPMGLDEVVSYGATLAGRPGGRKALEPYLASRALGPRLVALSGFYGGKREDLAELQRFERDAARLPPCSEERACHWSCPELARVGSPSRPDTVGEFVTQCLAPTLGVPDLKPPDPTDPTPRSDTSGLLTQPSSSLPSAKVPRGNATFGAIPGVPGVTDLERVMAMSRARVRSCYRQGLAADPSMSGKLVVTITVDGKGEITQAAATTNTGISAAVAECVARVFRTMQLTPPTKPPATVAVPITFAQE